MSSLTVISVKNLSKSYRLGAIGSRTLTEDLNRWWAKVRKQPDPTLRIGQEHLAERLGERIWALKDINFEVQQGEALGIIGRNGAGKSTLLKILSRITAPTTGEVRVKGRIASLLEVGTGFHPELTGRENIFLNGAILGMKKPEIERKFDEIVDFAGVEKFIDTPVKRYSSGMYVRLAFAVAAHLDPEILVVDEVLAVGDAEFQKKCLGKMGEVAGEGKTVLFVSHNMGSIQQLCNRVIILNDGKITMTGNPTSAIQEYLLGVVTSTGEVNFSNKIKKNEKAIITRLTLKNELGETTNNFSMGKPLSIELDLYGLEKVSNLSVCLYIKTSTGIPVYHFFNNDEKIEITKNKETLRINATFEEILLYPGSYSISAWIGDSMGLGFDHKKDCIIFNVYESDKFNRRNLSWDYAIVMPQVHWEIN